MQPKAKHTCLWADLELCPGKAEATQVTIPFGPEQSLPNSSFPVFPFSEGIQTELAHSVCLQLGPMMHSTSIALTNVHFGNSS